MLLKQTLAVILLWGIFPAETRGSRGHISVVLLGANGDLARKYLWRSLFQLYADEVTNGHTFTFYGADRKDPDVGRKLVFDHLKNLACSPEVAPNRCAVLKDQFLKLTEYHRLKSEEDYADLNQGIKTSLAQEELVETGRIFYLSVPPFAYAEIARHINSSCRPPSGAWLRVVLEKPFGHDLLSAQRLAQELATVFHEEEIYRVDHYLGKQAVTHILPFRIQNRKKLDPLWNRHHVERVEIVLKETLDVKNRTEFYEQYGVLRDIHQNHLTEILMSLAMELPVNLTNSDEVLRRKLEAFSSLRSLEKNSAVIAQYEAYGAHVREELQKGQDFFTKTPTFAGVLVHLDNLRWEGVPFVLMSGKALDERATYLRILFKNRAHCVQAESTRESGPSHCKPKQIIFSILHGELNSPAILVSRNLFKPAVPHGAWKEFPNDQQLHLWGQSLSDYHVYVPANERDAYSFLISAIYHGRKESFITTENLLASWAFWSPLLDQLSGESPRLYPGGQENGALLDFKIVGQEVAFLVRETLAVINAEDKHNADRFQTLLSTFRESRLVTAWADDLIGRLASDIETTALDAIRKRGEFHLALSGGSSPLALFRQLASHRYTFPWKQTHLWMVDERCVPLADPESNFGHLHEHLLQHIRIPYFNLHPMPVHLNRRLCVEEDRGTELYANEIGALVGNSSFDLVILGMGTDGHTASLFPNSAGLEGNKDIIFAESPTKPHQRMSVTLALINKARQVSVLVLGKSKHETVSIVSRAGNEPRKWPISGVMPPKGQVSWYIDYEALMG
ncbi:GDH/6PGL endoplasmic bifunctional protein [Erythrolamprus reginae]|uniref:GDH/6PGL endoplasmic bifunctional protein n=1 Tax=Erythrolamprus reginae TaxID=121349 RepID=UPI00396CA4E1